MPLTPHAPKSRYRLNPMSVHAPRVVPHIRLMIIVTLQCNINFTGGFAEFAAMMACTCVNVTTVVARPLSAHTYTNTHINTSILCWCIVTIRLGGKLPQNHKCSHYVYMHTVYIAVYLIIIKIKNKPIIIMFYYGSFTTSIAKYYNTHTHTHTQSTVLNNGYSKTLSKSI
jgi:hypothetical protein